jgi:hypothetical protein
MSATYPSPSIGALKRPSSLVECARLAQVLVMPVGASRGEFGGHCDWLHESGTSLTSFTKCGVLFRKAWPGWLSYVHCSRGGQEEEQNTS